MINYNIVRCWRTLCAPRSYLYEYIFKDYVSKERICMEYGQPVAPNYFWEDIKKYLKTHPQLHLIWKEINDE